MHKRSPDIVLDVTSIDWSSDFYVLGEALFLKVTNGKLIGVGQEVFDATLCAVVLDVIHHVSAVALDLFVARNGAKNDLSESLTGEGAEANSTDWCAVLNQCQRFVFAIFK